MLPGRTKDNQITIKVSVDSFGLQRLIDYVKYLEVTAGSKVNKMTLTNLPMKSMLPGGIRTISVSASEDNR
jgi:hypothetical protein